MKQKVSSTACYILIKNKKIKRVQPLIFQVTKKIKKIENTIRLAIGKVFMYSFCS